MLRAKAATIMLGVSGCWYHAGGIRLLLSCSSSTDAASDAVIVVDGMLLLKTEA